MVKCVGKIGVIALALVISALPTMACLLPTATLTAAEQECCKRMAHDCGNSGMPASHSCCQRVAGPESTFIKASAVQLDHNISTHLVIPPVDAPLATIVPLDQASLDFDEHGPPGSPPATISVLRI